MRIIKDIDELKALSKRKGGCDCHIMLNFGLRSSKHVTYNEDKGLWQVYHEIDDTWTDCTTEQLSQQTNIPEALSKNALVLDE